jgi:hypothetical protein
MAGAALLGSGLGAAAAHYGQQVLGSSANAAVGIVDGMPITMQDLVEAHRRGDHVVDGGPGVGAFWARNIQAAPPPQDLNTSLATLERDLARRQAFKAAGDERAALAARQSLGPLGMAALQMAAEQGALG